jgi:peroxiredoxin
MTQFESYQDEITRRGSLLYVAAEKRSGIFKPAEFLEKHPISFPFLLDEQRNVTKSYGVYHPLGKDALHIARPSTFIVDPSGILRYIYVGEGQLDRAPLEQVMEAFRAATPT